MTGRTRLSIARKDIAATFDAQPTRVFQRREIEAILRKERSFWRLADRTTVDEFTKWLSDHSHLKTIELQFPKRPRTVYAWRDASAQEVALAVGKHGKSYLGYHTAASLHSLTTQVPKTLYVCEEQTGGPGPKQIKLSQKMVDESFAKPARESSTTAVYENYWTISVVAAVASNSLGVSGTELPQVSPKQIMSTDLERTLIDLVIRPHYGGGIAEVLDIYRNAVTAVSVNRIGAYLSKLKYAYPYHQSIGFCLEVAGIPRESLVPLSSLPRELDLPLVHGVERGGYSDRWRVWYPEGFI